MQNAIACGLHTARQHSGTYLYVTFAAVLSCLHIGVELLGSDL